MAFNCLWSIFVLKIFQESSEARLISALLIRNALRADGQERRDTPSSAPNGGLAGAVRVAERSEACGHREQG